MQKEIVYTPDMIARQRGILSGILLDEYIIEENQKKFEVLKYIKDEKYFLFSKTQKEIIKKMYDEVIELRKEGDFSSWIFNEAFIEDLNDMQKNEIIEIQSTSPITAERLKYYLKQLDKLYKSKTILDF